MRNIAHVCLFASLALSVQGAMAVTTGSPANCPKDGGCTVTVSVGGNTCGAGIAVSLDPINVSTAKGGPVTITWKVIGGWEFDAKGIDIFMGGAEVNAKPGPDKVTYMATNAAKTKGSFKYDINLVRIGAPETKCSLDPTIVNH